MPVNFEFNYLLSFVFSNDLKNVSLTKNDITDIPYFSHCKDKLNGIMIEPNINKINNVTLSKKYLEQFNLKTDPNQWKMVLNLQNIQKIWQFSIYSIIIEESTIYKDLVFYSVKNLPNNCFPYLKWLIPLLIDPIVYNSNFNQIIIN